MGVTIHFEGALKDEDAYRRATSAVTAFAKYHGWNVSPIEESCTTLQRVRNEKACDYVGPARGLVVQPHPNSDPLRFEFDSELYVQEYCKTQFSLPETHALIVELLRELQPNFQSLTVTDEGEFWETSDVGRLQKHFDACFRALEKHLRNDPDATGPVRIPGGRILDLVTSS